MIATSSTVSGCWLLLNGERSASGIIGKAGFLGLREHLCTDGLGFFSANSFALELRTLLSSEKKS
jgi:hypothetical protein